MLIKPNHFNFRLSKCKQNKYVMDNVVVYGGMITATDRIVENFFCVCQ